MEADHSHIPVEFIQRAIILGQGRIAKFIINLKMKEDYRIDKSRWPRDLLLLAWNAGMITRCRKTGEYYQCSWLKLTKGYKSVTYITIDHSFWDSNSFQDIAYLAAMAFLVRLQEKRKPLASARKHKKFLKLSAHFGGIAHSLISKFFGKSSKAWSYGRRESLKAKGLLGFTRRWAREPAYARVPASDDPYLNGCFNTHNGVGRELASFVDFLVPVDLMGHSRARKRLRMESVPLRGQAGR